jgi:hypothetical protein
MRENIHKGYIHNADIPKLYEIVPESNRQRT